MLIFCVLLLAIRYPEKEPVVRYVRFQTKRQDSDSHRPSGIFVALYDLRDSGELATHDADELNKHLDWLKMHLKSPACLKDIGNERAISWFHPRAKEPIRRVRAIVEILREYGVVIDQITTDHPGTVLYEDGWQVVAKPPRK